MFEPRSRYAYLEISRSSGLPITCFFVDQNLGATASQGAALEGALSDIARLGEAVASYLEVVGNRSVSSSFVHKGNGLDVRARKPIVMINISIPPQATV